MKSVFSKDKDAVYAKFPHLSEITRPKMPIISPKGDEVILRTKFQEQLNLLSLAVEMDRQRNDEEGLEKISEAESLESDGSKKKKSDILDKSE